MARVKNPLPGWPVIEVPLSSFFRAINGFGLSTGAPASAQRFLEILKTKKIAHAIVEPVGQPERVIVKQIICEDGTKLHFDTSARGACCYFIEEPGPSCVEVFDGRFSDDVEDADAVSDSNREEVGRDSSANGDPEGDSNADVSSSIEQSGAGSLSPLSTTRSVHEAPASGSGSGGSVVRV